MTTTRNLLAALGVMLVFVTAACGSDEGSATADESTSTAPPASDDDDAAVAAPATSTSTTTASTTTVPSTAAPAGGDTGDECVVGSWEATPEEAQRWAEEYADALLGAEPAAAGAVVTVASAAFTSEFRPDGTGTNTSLLAGSVTHPLGEGDATLSSVGNFTWSVDGDELTFTYTDGTVDNEIVVDGLTLPFAGSVPTSGTTSTVEFTCTADSLQADFVFEPLAPRTPDMQRVG